MRWADFLVLPALLLGFLVPQSAEISFMRDGHPEGHYEKVITLDLNSSCFSIHDERELCL